MRTSVVSILAALMLASATASAGQTVGLFLNDPRACPGYTLFAPPYPEVYLINNEGMLVHSWLTEHSTERYVLSEEGYLCRGINLDSVHPIFGKPVGGVTKQDWDGTVLWYFIYSGEKYSRHHDVEFLPNGNALLVAYESLDSATAVQIGRAPGNVKKGKFFPDYVVELQQTGDSSASVVWEWHFTDHAIQDIDPTKDNYGVVADHPELVNINAGDMKEDWPHLNSVAYNPEFDQIMLTCAHTSEIYVIDHSTTTAEAAGHTGGRYGRGGDFLYRWGNPQMYNHGDSTNRRLFSCHDGHWLGSGVSHVMIFSNGVGRGYSSIEEIVPPLDSTGTYAWTDPRFGPVDPIWTWTAPNPTDFYLGNGGGAQRLPNGNTLTCNVPIGEIFEVTEGKELVWRYINPVNGSGPVHQGDSITGNSVGGATRYPLDYPAFAGKDLTPQGPIELGMSEGSQPICPVALKIHPSITARATTIAYQLDRPGPVRVRLYNALGQEVRTLVDGTVAAGAHQVTWDGTDHAGQRVSSGVYFCKLEAGAVSRQQRLVLVR